MQNNDRKNLIEIDLHKADPLQKKAYIFGTLFVLANRLQALGDALDDKITLKQWLFITVIVKSEKQALTITELAQLIGTSRQNVKKMAAILEKDGFITFEKDSSDARILRVALTEKCKNHFAKRGDLEIDFITKLFERMDNDTLDKIAEGFGILMKNISEMEK
jgi:DNA-binding MarR family transcriptional regulator